MLLLNPARSLAPLRYEGELEGGRLVWLLANTVCETTYVAMKVLEAGVSRR